MVKDKKATLQFRFSPDLPEGKMFLVKLGLAW
jgi:hypothetical protein